MAILWEEGVDTVAILLAFPCAIVEPHHDACVGGTLLFQCISHQGVLHALEGVQLNHLQRHC